MHIFRLWGETIQTIDVELDGLFKMRNPDPIKDFINSHVSFQNLLIEAHKQINRIFGEHAREVRLRKYVNPEEGDEGLTITVKTDLDVEKSLDLLDRFDDEWWLDAKKDHTETLIIQVESRGF